jgi:YVTN family beta-propeller protein
MRFPLLLLAFLLATPALAAESKLSTKVRQKLYVTNSAGDDITVYDVATNKKITTIEVGKHPHGIAVPAAQNFILVSIEGTKPGQLVWIDPITDKVTQRMNIGPAPNQLAVTPNGKFAYVPVDNGYWEVIDLGKKKMVTRIFTGGRPHNTLCSRDGKRMYLAPMGSPKRVFVVDTGKHKKVGEIAFSNSVRPIALDPKEKRLYAEVDGLIGIEVADLASRKKIHRVVAELAPKHKKVASRSHGLGVRPDGKEVWECDVHHREVHVYDVTGDKPKQVATIPMDETIYWLTFAPDSKTCYVAVRGKNGVAVVDTKTRKIRARLPVGKVPKRLIVVGVPEKASR